MGKKKNGDDFYNVSGYFRARSKQLAETQSALITAMEQADAQLEEMQAIRDTNRALMEQLGISLSDLEAIPVEVEQVELPKMEKISLPADIDYHREFQKLVRQAEAEGFTNVPISALLTEEERTRAQLRGLQLDIAFDEAVAFRPADILVISIGIAMHLLRIVLTAPKQEAAAPSAPVNIYEANRAPVFDDIARPFDTVADTDMQVPLSPGYVSPASSAAEFLRMLPFKRTLRIKSADEILADTPCFLLTEDVRYPEQSDYLGNHSLWGWIVGVFNIITDTVTVKDLQTFQPEADATLSMLHLSDEQLPFRDLFIPFIDNGLSGMQDELIAGVIREAYILIPNQVDYGDFSFLFRQAKQTTAKATYLLQDISSIVSIGGLNGLLMDAGWSNLINTLLIAIHGLFCKKEENQHQYMVRTMKVVTAANLIGTALGSLPAVATEQWQNLDFGGALTGAANIAALTRLWSDVKAEFLVSEYLPNLINQLNVLDKYFETV